MIGEIGKTVTKVAERKIGKLAAEVAQWKLKNRCLGGITKNEPVINGGNTKSPKLDSERLIILDRKYESPNDKIPSVLM